MAVAGERHWTTWLKQVRDSGPRSGSRLDTLDVVEADEKGESMEGIIQLAS